MDYFGWCDVKFYPWYEPAGMLEADANLLRRRTEENLRQTEAQNVYVSKSSAGLSIDICSCANICPSFQNEWWGHVCSPRRLVTDMIMKERFLAFIFAFTVI
jgi:hypothetical protein